MVWDLVSLAEFRVYLRLEASYTQDNGLLQALIASTSAEIERFIGREFEVKERTNLLDSRPLQTEFVIPAAPLHSVSEVKHDIDREFLADSVLEITDYEWESDQRRLRGILKLDYLYLVPGPGVFQVKSVGGWAFDRDYYVARQNDPPVAPALNSIYLVGAVPTGAWVNQANKVVTWNGASWVFKAQVEVLLETYPQLKQACMLQAGYVYRTKDVQGSQQSQFKGASVMTRSLGLLNLVLDLIKPLQNQVTRIG